MKQVGTDELTGCVVVSHDSSEMTLEKDGRKFHLYLEYEEDFDSMNDCNCWQSGHSYFRLEEYE